MYISVLEELFKRCFPMARNWLDLAEEQVFINMMHCVSTLEDNEKIIPYLYMKMYKALHLTAYGNIQSMQTCGHSA